MEAARTMTSMLTPPSVTLMPKRGTPVNVVLMGPPGAGKGTQAGTVARLIGVAHVASGDLLREAVKNGTEYGRLAQAYMDRGDLVPDEITVAMVISRLHQPDGRNGFILDGFPRTVSQAKALDELLEQQGKRIDVVLNLVVPRAELLARLSGRWLCRNCHASYHMLLNPPASDGVCDRCGGELFQREDDKEETARHRLDVYDRDTRPVLEYYRSRGILHEVRGDRPVAEVTNGLCVAITAPRSVM